MYVGFNNRSLSTKVIYKITFSINIDSYIPNINNRLQKGANIALSSSNIKVL